MSQIEEAQVQLTDERKRLSEVTILLKLGIDSKVSFRPETTLGLRSTEMAFMWLGKAKGALGIRNPYPQSTDPSSPVIEPPQDTVTDLSKEVQEVLSGIKKAKELEVVFVKQARKLLDGLCSAIKNDMSIMTDNKIYQICIQNAWTNAEEAKMRLGQVLGKIRDEEGEKAAKPAKAKEEKAPKVKAAKPAKVKGEKSPKVKAATSKAGPKVEESKPATDVGDSAKDEGK